MKVRVHSSWRWFALAAWTGALIFVFYGAALQLPFLADDYFHLPFVDSHSLTDMWRTAGGLYYFRPVSYTVWKIMEPLFGYHNAVAQHALNLGLHWANALLTAWLAGALWASKGKAAASRQFLSATLFVLYPFSYEAVPWVGSLVHPLVTCCLLLSVAAYVKMRLAVSRARLIGWAALSLAFALLGPFTHENGILIVPLLGAIELTWPAPWSTLWRRLLRITVWLIPIAIWFLIWRTVPAAQGGAAVGVNRPTEIWRNLVYAAQGSAYPITWLGGWLRSTLDLPALATAWWLSVVGCAAAAAIQKITHAGRRGWLPWLWIGMALMPALLFLENAYFSAAPRTLMLASVGIAWLWTDVLVRLAEWGRAGTRWRTVSVALAIGLVVGLLVQNGLLIQSQMRLYEMAGVLVRQVVAATVAANQAGQTATFINLPVWITYPQLNYAAGQEGVVFGPAPDQLETMVSVHTGQPAQMQGLRIESIQTELPYYVGLMRFPAEWGTTTNGRVFVTRYTTTTMSVQAAGEYDPAIDATAPPLARFDRAITLIAADAQPAADGLQVNLVWRTDEAVPLDMTAFVHILDANGQLIAQADGDPIANTYAFAQWPPGSIVRDIRTISVNNPAAVRVGLYNRATGQRLTALTPDGQSLPDNAVPIPLAENLP